MLHWPSLGRQVRVAGVARPGSEAQSDALWGSRGRDARLVDVASDEGAPLASADEFRAAFAAADAAHGEEIPRPAGWAAVRVLVGNRRVLERRRAADGRARGVPARRRTAGPPGCSRPSG